MQSAAGRAQTCLIAGGAPPPRLHFHGLSAATHKPEGVQPGEMRDIVVAVGCAAGVAAAQGAFAWSQERHIREWHPARQTAELGYQPWIGALPFPTQAPVVDVRELQARSGTDNTCAYISGIPSTLPSPPRRGPVGIAKPPSQVRPCIAASTRPVFTTPLTHTSVAARTRR